MILKPWRGLLLPPALGIIPATRRRATAVNTLILLHLQGTSGSTSFPDVAGGTVWTANGSAAISTAQGKFGGSSLSVTGSGSSYISTPNTNLYTFSGDFTVECWMYPSGTQGANATVTQGASSGAFQIGYDGSTQFGSASALVAWDVQSTTLPTVNAWNHVAISRSGSTLRAFIGGTLTASATRTGGYSGGTGSAERIGQNNTGTAFPFAGYVQEYRVSNIARYTSNFTPSSTPFAVD